MKHHFRRLTSLMLCTLLLLCSLRLPALADEKQTRNVSCTQIDAFFGTCYYVPSSLQESCTTFDVRSDPLTLTLASPTDEAGSQSEQALSSAKISFIEGSESLRDAISLDSEKGAYCLSLDNSKLLSPGTAVFHFRLESDQYLYEADKTLIVLNFDDAPFFEVKDETPILYRITGEAYPKYAFPKLYLTFNAAKAYTICKEKAPDQVIDPVCSYNLTAAEGSPAFKEEIKTSGTLLPSTYVIFPEEAMYDLRAAISMGNVTYTFPFRVAAAGYRIVGPDAMSPGETVSFTITGSDQAFTWSVEGEGAAVDETSGEVTSSADFTGISSFTLTATPPAPGLAVSRKIILTDSLLGRFIYSTADWLGYTLPCPVSSGWTPVLQLPQGYVFVSNYGTKNNFQVQCLMYPTDTAGFILTNEAALREYDHFYSEFSTKGEAVSMEKEIISIGGHAASVSSYAYLRDGQFYGHYGDILLARNNTKAFIRFILLGPDEKSTYRFTLEELKYIAAMISYDENWSIYTAADAAVSVNEKNGISVTPAGRTLSFSAAFANAKLVNKANKNDSVTWSVHEAGSEKEVPEAKISKSGQLSVDAKLSVPVTLEIKAVSDSFLTSGSCQVTVLPQVKKILTDPAELSFYVGSDVHQTVKAILEPDTVPPTGITWTPAGEGIVEITDSGNGTVSIRALAAGNTTINVQEPGGKKAHVKVSVMEPVTAVEINLSGKGKAGGKVKAEALLTPSNAGNKKVEWSLNVGEDVAVINSSGQIHLAKDVPAGTKIIVTCKALGAAEPLTASAEFTTE